MSAELEARRSAAAGVLANFDRVPDLPRPDYRAWAYQLRAALAVLLDQLGREPASGYVALSRAELLLTLSALDDAAAYRFARGDAGDVTAYRALSRRLGDDR